MDMVRVGKLGGLIAASPIGGGILMGIGKN